MALPIDELPDDVESLKALLLAAHAASQAAEVERLTARERLDHIVAVLPRVVRPSLGTDHRGSDRANPRERRDGAEDAATEKTSDTIRSEGTKARRANRGHLQAHRLP